MQNINGDNASPWYIPFLMCMFSIVRADVSVIKLKSFFHKFIMKSISIVDIRCILEVSMSELWGTSPNAIL